MSIAKNPTTDLGVDLFGPKIEFLIAPEDSQSDFCVMKGIIPPGEFVPLHSHPETEDFLILSGEVQVLKQGPQGQSEWITAKTGDYIHVPINVPHAFRNVGNLPVIQFITATKKLGQFLLETGRPLANAAKPATPEDFARPAVIGARYGFWIATPAENAAIGIHL
ncbi:cupin domain-containing protein [Ktedonosporobacter rubrisoli]|uniref:Cupin domain-containing protein n=1 Tax=Ktedonosporobacter rubrisoli TaxID=2509675 RepID=A0A4P6JYB0_KTERU|nr:cupin domain-containing protein [Ktedonosporobacter rubrisoli]QBD80505.1 cupin domain-containing protein [Ktedonosporobacter rubrisoli]